MMEHYLLAAMPNARDELKTVEELPYGGKVVLTLEINCGIGSVITEVECKRLVIKRYRHGKLANFKP